MISIRRLHRPIYKGISYAVSYAVTDIAIGILVDKGIGKLKKLGKVDDAADVAEALNKIDDAVDAADDVADAAKAVEQVEDAGKALDGLEDAAGVGGIEGGTPTSKPNQVHHYATDKNKTYTQAFKDITDKYGLDLDADWNKDLLPHQGRHPNAYHDFVLDEMRNIDNIANGNKDIFLDLYESEIKSIIRDNPDMLYSNYWKGIKE